MAEIKLQAGGRIVVQVDDGRVEVQVEDQIDAVGAEIAACSYINAGSSDLSADPLMHGHTGYHSE